jgi:heme-degrading monooxygenase HmoA
MLVYEVNLRVNKLRAEEFRSWLAEHVGEMLALPGFQSAEIFREETDETDFRHWTVHYRLESRAALENYFAQFAERMRRDGLDRFANSFSASRRVLLAV